MPGDFLEAEAFLVIDVAEKKPRWMMSGTGRWAGCVDIYGGRNAEFPLEGSGITRYGRNTRGKVRSQNIDCKSKACQGQLHLGTGAFGGWQPGQAMEAEDGRCESYSDTPDGGQRNATTGRGGGRPKDGRSVTGTRRAGSTSPAVKGAQGDGPVACAGGRSWAVPIGSDPCPIATRRRGNGHGSRSGPAVAIDRDAEEQIC